MKFTRRSLLKYSSLSAIGAAITSFSSSVFAQWPTAPFETKAFDEAFSLITGGATVNEGHVTIEAPQIADNGASVPIVISTDLEGAESISVFVENNPRPFITTFYLNDMLASSVSLRVKMRETSDLIAVVKSPKGQFMARQNVKVTAGGCG
jgi:sulfur-oxidizing protein SoxY